MHFFNARERILGTLGRSLVCPGDDVIGALFLYADTAGVE